MKYKNLEFSLKKANVSDEDLAAILNKPVETIQQCLSGQKDFTLKDAIAIRKLFPNVDSNWLFRVDRKIR